MFNVSKLLAVTEAWKFKGNRELISARNMKILILVRLI